MNKDRTLSWFFRLQREVQAIVLASPHGYLPHGVAGTIPDHTVLAHRDETPQNPRRWLLRPAEANLLEDERLRLDEWWNDLPNSARSALLESRAGHVPHGYREAVLDLVPGGAPPDTDLNTAYRASLPLISKWLRSALGEAA